MRIAIFTEVFLPKIDGITNRLRHTIDCLRRRGDEVLVFGPDTAVEEYDGVRVVRVPGLGFPPYPGLRVAAPDPRIVWELQRFQPQVVHAVGPACLGIWGMAAARALRLPVVASYHTDFPRYFPRYFEPYYLGWLSPAVWPLIRWIHNAATLNLCPSRFTQSELRENGVDEVGIWRGGVDTQRFHPRKRSMEMRMRLSGGRPDGPIVLYAGRLSPEKNLDVLADVLKALPEARMAFVGDGPARADLEKRFRRRRATFVGFLRGEELAAAYASADVFVMPSTTETLGFVVLEAMSSGLPVVAADAGGIPDLVRHGENGILFDPESPGDAAAALRDLLGSRAQRRHFAQQARKSAESGSWAAETEKLVDQYRKAIVVHQRVGVVGRLRQLLFA
jgi:glycosyltransferase involved in cell wall biosynthesis